MERKAYHHRSLPSGAAIQFSALSAREYQILALACQGLSSEQIGERLYFDAPAIEIVLRAMAEKMGLNNYVALVDYARRSGFDANCDSLQKTNDSD